MEILVLVGRIQAAHGLLNLLPVYPFDGGQATFAVLSRWYGATSAHLGLVRAGQGVALVGFVLALAFATPWALFGAVYVYAAQARSSSVSLPSIESLGCHAPVLPS